MYNKHHLEQAFDHLAEAVRLLQRFAKDQTYHSKCEFDNPRFGGLPETGEVDGETEELMARPRLESHHKLCNL